MRRIATAVVTAFLLATSACTASPPNPETPVVKTTAWETNGLKVEVTFHCSSRLAMRSQVTVKVTSPHPSGTAKVTFTIKTGDTTTETRPATELNDSSDAAWLSQTAQDGKAYSIFVYKDGVLIASTRLGVERCSPSDEQ